MNLFDLIKRKDRAVVIEAGQVEAIFFTATGLRYRAVRMAAGARLRLRDAHDFTGLKIFPSDPHLHVLNGVDAGGGVRILLVPHDGKAPIRLAAASPATADGATLLWFDWPVDATGVGFDLLFEQVGGEPVVIGVGPLRDMRAAFRPLLTGRGLEVGPGLNPQVLPAMADVEYLEEKHPREWTSTYGGGTATTERMTDEIMSRFRVGSAYTLDGWAPETFDFIFSNHVFEHFYNPLQVLRTWFDRLKPGGRIMGVTPDSRGCFDLRQPVSTDAEFLEEYRTGGFDAPDTKYERWCRYTAPTSTVENLKARNYSVHMHFYTPEVFTRLIALLRRSGTPCDLFLGTVPNNKDFAFLLRKPG